MDRRALDTLTELGGTWSQDRCSPAVEVVDLATLRRRAGAAALAAPHRCDAHTFILVARGRGWHGVDFTNHPCPAGTLVWVRPGQVQQFQIPSRLGGLRIRFRADPQPDLPRSSPLTRMSAVCGHFIARRLTSAEQAEVGGIADSLAAEYPRTTAPHHPDLLAHLLLALLLRVDRMILADADAVAPSADAELFARFEEELERSYATTRRAADYAGLLGCSVRTLTRACQETVGAPVRDVIDARVVLEAKRLLATTDEPLADLAHRLGLGDAPALGRFFTRHAAIAPTAFRRRHRDTRTR